MTPFPTRPLGGSGVRVGTLGCGCAAIGGLHGPVRAEAARDTLHAAWEEGIRFLDVSPLYGAGDGERRLGAFLAGRRHTSPSPEELAETRGTREPGRGRVLSAAGPPPSSPPRLPPPPEEGSRPVVSTKSGWIVEDAQEGRRVRADYSYAGTLASLEASLDRLGLTRLDAVFIHDLDASNHGTDIDRLFVEAMSGAYRALDEWRRAGRVGAVGIGVNDPAICVAAMEHGRFDAFLIAGRYTLLDQGALGELLPLCGRRGASLIAGAPFNTGILAKGAVVGATFAHRPASAGMLARVRAIEAVAAGHGVTLAAAALQFPLGHARVAASLPGPRTAGQMRQVAAAMRMPIPSGFWRDLKRQGLLADDVPVPDEIEVAA